MSTTTVLAIYPGEKIEEMKHLKNAWGSAPVVWDAMAGAHNGAWLYPGDLDKMFQDCETWPDHHRAMMYITADRAYVLRDHFAAAARHIREFVLEFPTSGRENHWPEIAALFEIAPDVPAIGFWMTSVSCHPFYGPYNEAAGGYDAVDWSTAISVYSTSR